MNKKYIIRIDSHDTHGWQVRLPLSIGNKTLTYIDASTHFFTDSYYKNSKACYQAAVRWRNKVLKQNGLSDFLMGNNRIDQPMSHSARNTSGAIGIALTVDIKYLVNGGTLYIYAYKASWCAGGKHYTRQFALIRHGKCNAFQCACKTRYEHKGVIIITHKSLIPCLPLVPYKMES